MRSIFSIKTFKATTSSPVKSILIFIKSTLIYIFILCIVLNPQSENYWSGLLICRIWTVACMHLCLGFVILLLKGAYGVSNQMC